MYSAMRSFLSDCFVRYLIAEVLQKGKNRRGTDNVLILNNLIRQQRKESGAYIIVVDFSKAFDRCHIATLLDKLSKKGIEGKILRIIKSMYTDAETQLSINGKLGKPFQSNKRRCPRLHTQSTSL